MLRAIWSSLQALLGSLGQGWTDLEDGQDPDSGHEMDPGGISSSAGAVPASSEGCRRH